MIEDEIEHESVATGVVMTGKPSEFHRANCQFHTYFSHEDKQLVHLLNFDPILKESQEMTKVESIIDTHSVFSSCESLEFYIMIRQGAPSDSSFNACLEFFTEFRSISIGPSDVISLAMFDVRPLRKSIYLFFPYL